MPVVERAVRTVKDRVRSLCYSVPFKQFPKLMTIHLVVGAVKWINRFPSKGGISDTLSASKIIEGTSDPDIGIKRVPFGTYVMLYAKTKTIWNQGAYLLSLLANLTSLEDIFLCLYK